MNESTRIFHIAHDDDLSGKSADRDYVCQSLNSEGFIHGCHQSQLAGVVSRYYRDVDAVHLMIIDADRLEAALVLENTVGGDELFPHIYGPINASAIIDIVPFGLNSIERAGLD